MQKKIFAVVGSWNFKESEKGFNVFDYDIQTGELSDKKHYDSTVGAGQQYFDKKRNVLYIVNECMGKPGALGGGGFLRAYAVDPETGMLSFMNEKCVLMTKPAYFWLDKSGDYGVVAAHTGRSCVTKIVRDDKNNFKSKVIFEDVGIALIRIKEDGSLGEISDIVLYDGLTPNQLQVHSHPHSIMGSPSGEIYFACDKGLDMIYSYKIDRKKGKIIPLEEKKMAYATAPRYSVFHPRLKVLYENNETSNELFTFNFDENTGRLETLVVSPLCKETDEKIRPSDLEISKDGQFLYAAVRGVNKIVVFSLDYKTGVPTRIQIISNPGGPRGLCISPDGRFLFIADNSASLVRKFIIAEDGTLSDTGKAYASQYAANIGFMVFD